MGSLTLRGCESRTTWLTSYTKSPTSANSEAVFQPANAIGESAICGEKTGCTPWSVNNFPQKTSPLEIREPTFLSSLIFTFSFALWAPTTLVFPLLLKHTHRTSDVLFFPGMPSQCTLLSVNQPLIFQFSAEASSLTPRSRYRSYSEVFRQSCQVWPSRLYPTRTPSPTRHFSPSPALARTASARGRDSNSYV